jgi:hypothetical protein
MILRYPVVVVLRYLPLSIRARLTTINVCNSVPSIVAELRVYSSVTKMTNVGRCG